MIKLGYSTGGQNLPFSTKERIKLFLSVQSDSIELSYIDAKTFEEKLDAEDIANLKKFKYRAIHAPVLITPDGIYENRKVLFYPAENTKEILDQIIEVADQIQAETILFHPDNITDFAAIEKVFGERLAFENMDSRKEKFNQVKDLQQAYLLAPKAKFVLDVNHIYTMDKSMSLAHDFYDNFKDRLCHYHLSAFGGYHDCFISTGEDIILNGLIDLEIPIIHEGYALKNGLISLKAEHQYILDHLNN